MNFTKKVRITDSVFTQVIDDEMVILDTESENYFGLDSIGTVMWEQLRVNNSLEELAQYMLEHYDVQEGVLKEDIKTFVTNLVKNKLISIG